jgi:hypothetical protein
MAGVPRLRYKIRTLHYFTVSLTVSRPQFEEVQTPSGTLKTILYLIVSPDSVFARFTSASGCWSKILLWLTVRLRTLGPERINRVGVPVNRAFDSNIFTIHFLFFIAPIPSPLDHRRKLPASKSHSFPPLFPCFSSFFSLSLQLH